VKDWPVALFGELPTAMILPSGWMTIAWTASLPLMVVVRTQPLPKLAFTVPSGLTRARPKRLVLRKCPPPNHGLPVGLDGHRAGAVPRLVQADSARVVERRAGRPERNRARLYRGARSGVAGCTAGLGISG
jgi:hypothetical protein